MTVDPLRRVHQTRPFQPFVMHLADGRTVRVEHPEFLALSPSGRTVIAYGLDDGFEILDLLLVVGVEVPNGKVA
ncbi:MAG: hypothetical protein AABZ47_09425 [Planctomycetota bacterium]